MEASTGGGKAPEPKETKKSGGAGESGLSDVGMVLAAIGGGIGVLGFVAFFGAAILWVRMDEAGMPANEAVAVIPKSVLVTTGASFLVPAVLIASGFTAILYLFESGREMFATWNVKSESELQRRRKVVEAKQDAQRKAAQKATEELELARSLKRLAAAAADADAIGEDAAENYKQASEQAYETVGELSAEAAPDASVPDAGQAQPAREEELIRDEREIEEERVEALANAERFQIAIRIGLVVTLFTTGAIVAFILFSIHLRIGRILILAVVVLGLTAVCITVLSRFKFAWFTLATFVSVGVFIGFLTYYRTVDESKVEPVAVLRTNGAPEFGFFIAQTTDRIYLGTTQPRGEWRLDAILREEVADMTVGPLEPTEEANDYGRTLAMEICELALQRTSTEQQLTAAQPAGAGQTNHQHAAPCRQADLEHLQDESRAEQGHGKGSA